MQYLLVQLRNSVSGKPKKYRIYKLPMSLKDLVSVVSSFMYAGDSICLYFFATLKDLLDFKYHRLELPQWPDILFSCNYTSKNLFFANREFYKLNQVYVEFDLPLCAEFQHSIMYGVNVYFFKTGIMLQSAYEIIGHSSYVFAKKEDLSKSTFDDVESLKSSLLSVLKSYCCELSGRSEVTGYNYLKSGQIPRECLKSPYSLLRYAEKVWSRSFFELTYHDYIFTVSAEPAEKRTKIPLFKRIRDRVEVMSGYVNSFCKKVSIIMKMDSAIHFFIVDDLVFTYYKIEDQIGLEVSTVEEFKKLTYLKLFKYLLHARRVTSIF